MTSSPSDCFPYENPCSQGNNINYNGVGIKPSVTTVTTHVGKQYYIGIRHADKLKDFCCKVDANGNLQIKANYMSGVIDKTKDVNGTDLIKYEEVMFPAGKFGELIISPDSTVLIKINDVKSSSNKSNQLCIRLQNRDMDIFINGNLASRHRLAAPPKQNYGSVFVTQNEGFQGQISALRYFNYALSGAEIHEVNRKGPNLKADKNDQNFPPYLSLRWYFDN